jgi:hypothetical protein
MRAHRFSELFVVGQVCLVEGFHVERNESLSLSVRDLQVAVHIDDVLETKFVREAVGPAERFGREPGQVVDVMRSPLREQGRQRWIGKGFRVEDLLQAVQRLVAPGMFIQTLHPLPPSSDPNPVVSSLAIELH